MRLTFLGIVLAIGTCISALVIHIHINRYILTRRHFAKASCASALGLARTCPSSASGACYSVNVPDATAAGSEKDIYFQITGPSSMQWIGLGQGGQTRMKNSNIFILYADASGTNVTLSPRSGVDEVEPKYNSNAQVTLLDGSGISNGKMTANVRCTPFCSLSPL